MLPKKSIKRIALLREQLKDTTGFTYQRYFSIFFKQTTEVSPTEDRKEKKSQPQ